MGRRQPVKPKVRITFTPVADWDKRIRRVWALLLRPVSDQPNNEEVKLIGEAKRER